MSQDAPLSPEQLAAQLRCPHGDDATAVGESMNRANRALTRRSMALLAPQANHRVLEIGPGNAAFAAELVDMAPGVHYTGLDLSEKMISEALRLNAGLVSTQRARFVTGDCAALTFADGSFERVLSVNTLYFWQPAEDCLREIRRVMTDDGVLCLAFGDKRFMTALPFTAHGFTLYDEAEACAALTRSGWRIVDVTRHGETVTGNAGHTVQRQMLIIRASPAAGT